MRYYLTVEIESDATFSRGEGVAGLLDAEIEHDAAGCPFIRGRTLKGLLVEEWANLHFQLGARAASWDDAAAALFGTPGATNESVPQLAGSGRTARMHVGRATLPPDLRDALHESVRRRELTAEDVLSLVTTIRRQTAVDATTGAPEHGSLRTMRALLRGTMLIATLDFEPDPDPRELALLSACALAVRRGGVVRNRGRGRLRLRIHDQAPTSYADPTFTRACFTQFASEVRN
jgi:hypothetical protein